MIEPGESLSEGDLERVADLHVASIDDSLPSLLGRSFAARFYRVVAGSKFEWLFIERLHGRIESVCLLSLEPESIYGRILRSTLPWLVFHALVAVVTKPDFRAFLRFYVADRVSRGRSQHGPEITYVFSSTESRGQGMGRRLIERVEAWLVGRGVGAYHVKTLDEPGNRALSFYDHAGFSRLGRRWEGGRAFIAFRKTLGGP